MKMESYNEYIEEICERYGKTREQVEELAIVKEVKKYFENKPYSIDPRDAAVEERGEDDQKGIVAVLLPQ